MFINHDKPETALIETVLTGESMYMQNISRSKSFVEFVLIVYVTPPTHTHKIQALHTVLAKENDHVDHFIGFIYTPQTLTDSCQSI